MTEKTIAILGSTGSIGRQAIDAAEHRGYIINAMAFGSNYALGREQILRVKPEYCAVSDVGTAKMLATDARSVGTKLFCGAGCIEAMLSEAESDVCINGIGGFDGLLPTISAIKHCGAIGLANKESLVAAGDIVKSAATEYGKKIIPVDSEHSAIFRCIGDNRRAVRKLIITCSGGAFYGKTRAELEKVTRETALSHPTWKMGTVITVNCATLMNKGLEVIEAAKLFDVPEKDIDVVIHRESIIHSMVEFRDGAVLAELSAPDMRLPIQYAMDYPDCEESQAEPIDFIKLGSLTFSAPDTKTFPLLDLARYALSRGGVIPCAMNAANEVAVGAFLRGEIKFTDIDRTVISVTENFENMPADRLENIIAADGEARLRAAEILKSK